MKKFTHLVLLLAVCPAFSGLWTVPRAVADEARVTRVVHDVKLLPSDAKPKPAAVEDKDSDGTGVRTGTASRSELTFVDLTIERLGSNTVFSFDEGGRSVRLNGGSMLLRVPKDAGGANMSTSAVTVGITGTTVILESTRAGRNKLTVLEGGAHISLNKNPSESVYVRGGQMEDVPAGASKLPSPVNVNLSNLMNHHPLITGFGPLPSRNLIMATASHPPSPQGRSDDAEPSGPGPVIPAIIPTIIGVGLGPVLGGGGGHHTNTDTHTNTHTNTVNHTNTKFPGRTRGKQKDGAHPNGTPSKVGRNNPP